MLARARLSSAHEDLALLLKEVKAGLSVPVQGLVSYGQKTIRQARARVFPAVAHQLCHFHYLREAAKPIYEADRHAKKEVKKQVRGSPAIERSLEEETEEEAQAVHGYCLSVRSSLTDDGRSPLRACGLRLHQRVRLVSDCIARVEEKKDCHQL